MKKEFVVVFLIAGFAVGLIITWQLLSDVGGSSAFPADELTAKEELFKDYLDTQSYLKSRIVYLREEIEASEEKIKFQVEYSNVETLDSLKADIGLKGVSGVGIEILLDDSPYALRDGADVNDKDLIQAADIRDIVNILFASNALAIAVNDQRIIAVSPISSVGSTLLVNNSYVAPPFTVSAVGDTDLMLQRLQIDPLLDSLYKRIASQNLDFQITVKEWVEVSIFNGDLNTNYLTLVD